MSVVRVEGIEFDLDDAREFARRARASSAGATRGGLSPRTALAVQIENAVDADGGDVRLSEAERHEASGVLSEWVFSGSAPKAAQTLYRLLAPGPEETDAED